MSIMLILMLAVMLKKKTTAINRIFTMKTQKNTFENFLEWIIIK